MNLQSKNPKTRSRTLSLSKGRTLTRIVSKGRNLRRRRRPRILLPSNGVIPPVLPPSPLTNPEVAAFYHLLAETVEAILLREQQERKPEDS